MDRKLAAKDVALIVCFTALYAVFASIPIFRIIGVPNANITAAAIVVPVIGATLGPFIGALSSALGGIIGFYVGGFFPPSLVSGIVATVCAGLLYNGKRVWSVLLYTLFLAVFGFFPSIGPVWLFPLSMWFQVIGLMILASPLTSVAVKNLASNSTSRLIASFFIIALTSTLAGQVSGNLTYMLFFPPVLGSWQAQWQGLTFVYPVERTIIALGSAWIGGPLLKILRSAKMVKTDSLQ
jgi:hypothetical protein